MRALAFVHSPDRTLIPESLRNTVSRARVHAVDWLPTLLGVAGRKSTLLGGHGATIPAEVAADGTVTPLKQPELDGVDVWPFLTPRVASESTGGQMNWEDSLEYPQGGVDPSLRQLVLNVDPFLEGQGLLHGLFGCTLVIKSAHESYKLS